MKSSVVALLVALGICMVSAINEPFEGFPLHNGQGHNLMFTNRGSTDRSLRFEGDEPFFSDGLYMPRLSVSGDPLPNERYISNRLHGQFGADTNPFGLSKEKDERKSLLLVFWAQFLDHDLSLTTENEEDPTEITVPDNEMELWFNPEEGIEVAASSLQPGTGPGTGEQSRFPNVITAWIDGNNVYGSDAETAAKLRGTGGFMLTSGEDLEGDRGPLLPLNWVKVLQGNDRELVEEDELFAAGDRRANENVVLTAFHTLFVREHNRKVYELMEMGITDPDELYNKARLWVIAVLQSISVYKFLPEITGEEEPLGPYFGYDESIVPNMGAAFTTAAFRFGHTMLAGLIPFMDEEGNIKPKLLRELFFLPGVVKDDGITPIFRGCAHANSEKFDELIIDDVRNHLFAFGSGAIGQDLMVRNIFRGRHHGIAPYNKARENFGLEKKYTFQDITDGCVELSDILDDLYDDIEDVDLWVGGTSEPKAKEDGVLGETFSAIIKDQFKRIRDGDYYWFENSNGAFSNKERKLIRSLNLGDIIRMNTNVGEDFPSNVFKVIEG